MQQVLLDHKDNLANRDLPVQKDQRDQLVQRDQLELQALKDPSEFHLV